VSALPHSWLFTPGSRPDRFKKAANSGAEAIILDLEDAVSAENKDQARSNVIAFLDTGPDIHPAVAVRINPLTCCTGLEDLVALSRLTRGPDFIVIPKAENPAHLELAGNVLNDAGSLAQLAALIESARGVTRAAEIAQSCSRLAALIFGAADYAADLFQAVGAFQPEFARASIVNAAAAGGIVAIDSPFFAIDRPEELKSECLKSRSIGFFGKAAIHPAQLEFINTTFPSTRSERELAQRILEAAPDGVGTLDGKMIDAAMVRWARRIA